MIKWDPSVCECKIMLEHDGSAINSVISACEFHSGLVSDLPALMEKLRDECVLVSLAGELAKGEAEKLPEEAAKEHLQFETSRDQSGELKVTFPSSQEKGALETSATTKAATWRTEYNAAKAAKLAEVQNEELEA